MFTYEGGLLLSFLLWLSNAVLIVIKINSKFEKNLNRIGQRLSWFTLAPKPMEAGDKQKSILSKTLKYLFVVGVSLPFIFLSWLYVAYAACFFVYRLSQDFGAPQSVRELRWKLKNIDLTFDQLLKELMKASDEDPTTFSQYRANIIEELEERGITAPH